MGDGQCNGLRILSGGHVRYDTNADHLLQSEEIARIPPDEQRLDVFSNASQFMWQDVNDVACNFLQLDLWTQLNFIHRSPLQRQYFWDMFRSSDREDARRFVDFFNDLPYYFMDFLYRATFFDIDNSGSESELLSTILRASPQILAFGEYHSSIGDRGPTTVEVFADRILPVLKNEYGYSDIVLEFLPWDMPTSELAYFMEHGEIDDVHTPFIMRTLGWLAAGSALDCLYILNRCRELGMNVHGGAPSIYECIFYQRSTLVDSITRNSEMQLDGLADTGKKVIFYGGAAHVDRTETEMDSFGGVLAAKHSYVEVDLIGPRIGSGDLRDYVFYLLGKEQGSDISNDGSLLSMNTNDGVYIMIYPADLYTSVPISPIQNLIDP